jgi:hemerythrin-like domain-containing protein
MSRKAESKSSSIDATELLAEDHQKILQMFSKFEKIKKDKESDIEIKQTLVEKVCMELTIHSQIEEEFLYPALREAIKDADLLDEAEVEHNIANQLILELESMDPEDEFYDAKFTVLGEYVRHHIEEEQNKLFPKAHKAKIDLSSLGKKIRTRREELRLEFCTDDNDELLNAAVAAPVDQHGRTAAL